VVLYCTSCCIFLSHLLTFLKVFYFWNTGNRFLLFFPLSQQKYFLRQTVIPVICTSLCQYRQALTSIFNVRQSYCARYWYRPFLICHHGKFLMEKLGLNMIKIVFFFDDKNCFGRLRIIFSKPYTTVIYHKMVKSDNCQYHKVCGTLCPSVCLSTLVLCRNGSTYHQTVFTAW